jgi:hypothetical protein
MNSRILAFSSEILHNSAVPVWLERFALVVLAAAFGGIVILNSLKMDGMQRTGIAMAILGLSIYIAQTIHIFNQSKAVTPAPPPVSAPLIQPSQPQSNNQRDVPPKKERKLPASEQPLLRILSEEQIASLGASLQLATGNRISITVITENDPETQQLAKQIVTAFQNAKWQISQKIIGKRTVTVIGDPSISELNPEAGLICTGPTLDSELILKTRSAFNRARVKCLWAKE